MKIVYTKHAQEMLVFRNVTKRLVDQCVKSPNIIKSARENKLVYLKDCGVNYLKIVVSKEENRLIIITLHWLAKQRVKQ